MRVFRCVRPALFIAFALALSPRSVHAGPGEWSHDFETAEAEAKRLRRPLLVHFEATWCGPCQKMEREVLNDPVLAKQLQAFVAVKIDADNRLDLAKRFNVRTLPSDLFLDPNGNLLDRSTGSNDRKAYLSLVARAEALFAQSQRTHIASQTVPRDFGSTPPQRPGAPLVAPSPLPRRETGAEPIPVAIASPTIPQPRSAAAARRGWVTVGLLGFSPVSLGGRGAWVRGNERFACTYKGIAYYMASPEELLRFRETPDRYAPQILGCDPVILEATDRAVPGDVRYAAYFDGALYLFVSEKSRQTFTQDPERYVRTKHVLKVDELEEKRLE